MTDCKTFHGVTTDLFDCVKTRSEHDHGTSYQPPDAPSGTSTTDTVVGKVVVTFDLDVDAQSLTYCITSKPFIVSASQVFNGIADTINQCRASKAN